MRLPGGSTPSQSYWQPIYVNTIKQAFEKVTTLCGKSQEIRFLAKELSFLMRHLISLFSHYPTTIIIPSIFTLCKPLKRNHLNR